MHEIHKVIPNYDFSNFPTVKFDGFVFSKTREIENEKNFNVNNCMNRQTADSTCDTICDWCRGTATTPEGYVYKSGLIGDSYQTSFSRHVNQECGETTYSCVCNDKSSSLAINAELLCNTGYYGTPTYTYTERYGDYFAGCYPCPSSGTTAGPGATSITECYIPSGNTFADDSGSGEYSGDCYYTN